MTSTGRHGETEDPTNPTRFLIRKPVISILLVKRTAIEILHGETPEQNIPEECAQPRYCNVETPVRSLPCNSNDFPDDLKANIILMDRLREGSTRVVGGQHPFDHQP